MPAAPGRPLLLPAAAAAILPAAAGLLTHAALRRAVLHPRPLRAAAAADPPAQLIEQPLNHSDPGGAAGTFQQRYWVRDEWWCGDSSCPVFLCVGGEGPGNMDKALTNDSVHCGVMLALAPRMRALTVAMEHRFYGTSLPAAGRSLDALRHLTSAGNVADFTGIHARVAGQHPGAGAARWVAFGGSYPGMMASFLRLKHPDLIYAAVASSAPVQATYDYTGYLDVVGADLADPQVGGSEECLRTVRDGHAALGRELAGAAGQARVAADFKLCNRTALADRRNAADWAGFGVIPLDWQGNDPACGGELCNIAKMCDFLLGGAPGAPRDRLANLSAALLRTQGQTCVDVDHPGANAEMRRQVAAGDASDGSWPVSWFWQTCNEWGFYQTCEAGSRCPFTTGVNTVDVAADACPEVFGVPLAEAERNTARANARFGGRAPRGSRVMYVNGGEDPWHAASVLPPGTARLPAYLAPGVSHHFWTHPEQPTDSAADGAARGAVERQVRAWLRDEE